MSSHMYPENSKGPSNRRLNEHGIYTRHCQESNSQPVPSQAGTDTTTVGHNVGQNFESSLSLSIFVKLSGVQT